MATTERDKRAWVRPVRLWCGLILFAYLTTHFANHAVGLVSLAAINLLHGLPFLGLVWFRCNRRWEGQTEAAASPLLARLSQRRAVWIFYGLLLVLALVEEGLWDGVLWGVYVAGLTGLEPPSLGDGTRSLLVAVRDRMLAENPEADVAGIEEALGAPEAHVLPDPAPQARARARAPPGDDFLERYLELSVEFEERFGVKGWADFVAKKTEPHRRHPRGSPAAVTPRPRAKGKAKPAHRKR